MHFELSIDGERYAIEADIIGDFAPRTRRAPAEAPTVDIREAEPSLPADLVGRAEELIVDELRTRRREHQNQKRRGMRW